MAKLRPQICADLRWSNRVNSKGSHGFSRINTDHTALYFYQPIWRMRLRMIAL